MTGHAPQIMPDQRQRMIAHAKAILSICGEEADPDWVYLLPQFAMSMLRMGADATEGQRRNLFESIRRTSGVRTRLLRGNSLAVHIQDWTAVVEKHNRQFLAGQDWSEDGAEDRKMAIRKAGLAQESDAEPDFPEGE